MLLSIVVVTRNRIGDLKSCVDSIKKSNFKLDDTELIIIDDNSTDGTEKIIFSEFDFSSGKIIHNKKQEMMVRSRNLGAREARGKYVLFVDDDNIVDCDMLSELVAVADDKKYTHCGIIGPAMYYLDTKEKYLDYQKIDLFTGRTYGKIDCSSKIINESDGVPNAFLIKKEVFDKCGFFDEQLIQTFTEPDFAFNAKRYGYGCVTTKKAKIFHNTSHSNALKARSLGGQYTQKAYCLMRNRTIFISRYGKVNQKIIYLLFFSWFWPTLYSILMLREGRFDLIRLYWRGFFDGMKYVFTKRLNSRLKMKG